MQPAALHHGGRVQPARLRRTFAGASRGGGGGSSGWGCAKLLASAWFQPLNYIYEVKNRRFQSLLANSTWTATSGVHAGAGVAGVEPAPRRVRHSQERDGGANSGERRGGDVGRGGTRHSS
jgi:hypothetical protein